MPHEAGAFGPDAARLPVRVRMASEADVAGLAPPEGQLRGLLAVSGAILLESGALVALGCPICLSNAVVAAGFAVVGVPVAVALDATERAELRRVERALAAGDLPARTRASLARLSPDAAAAAEAELLVVGYGFAEAGPHGACFFLDARLRVADREQAILLGPWRRSDDAPAPHCASRRELAADDGRLVLHVVEESAEILAGLVASRLGAAPLPPASLARTVGRLRRLAVVALPFEVSPRDPRWCLDPCDIAAFQREFEAHAQALLADWRGYELVRAAPPPDLAAASLAALGRAAGADGVLLLRGRNVYLTWLDGLSWFATLTFSIPISVARSGPRAQAELYETESGRVVWERRERRVGNASGAELAEDLLAPLELAWPRVLALPAAAPPR